MTTNASPFYNKAEAEYLQASTDEERIACLEIMIKECPKHKSSEKMLKNLTIRLKKLKDGLERKRKSGKSKEQGIKKADMQCVLAGFPNTGKSTIFNTLTKQDTKTSPHEYTTYQPQLGTFYFEDAQIQIIDDAPFPNHNKSLVNSTDLLLLIITNLEQIKKAEEYIWKSKAKIILIFNKEDILSPQERRKIEATIKSKHKKFDYIFLSNKSSETTLKTLRQKIFSKFPIIRIYTKEPSKPASKEPMILKEKSTVKDAAEKIRKRMSQIIKQTKIWGPSSKFGGQSVGINHVLKDKDVVEFKTK